MVRLVQKMYSMPTRYLTSQFLDGCTALGVVEVGAT